MNVEAVSAASSAASRALAGEHLAQRLGLDERHAQIAMPVSRTTASGLSGLVS